MKTTTPSNLYIFLNEDKVVVTIIMDENLDQLDVVFNKAFIYGEWLNNITAFIQVCSSDEALLYALSKNFSILTSRETQKTTLETCRLLGQTYTLDWWEPTKVAVNIRDSLGRTVYVFESPLLMWKRKEGVLFDIVDGPSLGVNSIGSST